MSYVQDVGDLIRVVRLRDVPGLPLELGELTFVILGRDPATEEERAQGAIPARIAIMDDPPLFTRSRFELVSSMSVDRAAYVRGILHAADQLPGERRS